ncbi:cupredoxin domain-containing protein [Stappia indica]|uniref:cupredoxin domain-containing protein n=1 Tax=Stappia indica TaxID=538381 RepID=UPI001CD3B989|nr:cupredoxin domain-containing protein [Stappia indica]MCA1297397.1 cupredoxin domain-containing protein [Stappia indica]
MSVFRLFTPGPARVQAHALALTLTLPLCLALAPAPSLAAEMPVFEMELRDGVVTPTRIVVEAGTTFKIVLRNTGTTAAEFESLRMRKEKVLGPGVTSFVVIRRLSPGSYPFFDEFHMDKETAHGVIVAR